MKKEYFTIEKDGFYGIYFENSKPCDKAIILMLGKDANGALAIGGAKWMLEQGCNVMTMSPAQKDYGHHSYPLERIEKAITYLKKRGNHTIGIGGASATGMVALVAASYFTDITLTCAWCPCDFVMEGFYQDGLDGAHERPGDDESSLTFKGEQLSFLRYAYRHPEYWQMIKKESKETGNRIASREMFEESERRFPLQEEAKIKVENIKGKLILVGAEDDALWNTCKYIRRMVERLENLPHDCEYEAWTYEKGTHFVFPQGMLKKILPIGVGFLVSFMFKEGRQHKNECKQTRLDIDKRLTKVFTEW